MLAAALALAAPANAQDAAKAGVRGVVVGQVVDADSREPLGGATVAVYAANDSSLATGATTEDDGSFVLDRVRPGYYFLEVSFVGYETHTVPDVVVSADRGRVELGTLRLTFDTTLLDEVEVAAEREFMEVGIDRTTYHTRNQPVNAGGSAQDMLENIPSVEVDIDGNISLRGSQGVSVYINGKPAPMSGASLVSFLEGLPVGDIERVEVIPNPSAAFEPEGTSGILNIVLARDVDRGWGGDVSGSAATRDEYGGSVGVNYGSGPWSMFSTYGLRYRERDRSGWRFRENRYLDPTTFLAQDFLGESGGFSNNLNTSLEYALSDRNSLSMSAYLSHRRRASDRLNRYEEMDLNQVVTDLYTRDTESDDLDFSMDYRLSFERIVTPRENELSVEAGYERERQSEVEQFVERLIPIGTPDAEGEVGDRQNVDEDGTEQELSLEVDYRRKLGEWANLDAGYMGELEWVDEGFYSESLDDGGLFVPDVDLNNTFVYSEQTHAAYGVLGARFGNLGAQLGLRFEGALTNFDLRTTNQSFDNRYFSIFPSLHLAYELGPRNTFKAAYSKRVRRPREWQLNPFGDFDDPTSIRVGNPYLTPEYTHSGELSYARLGDRYTITVAPYLRYSVDEISWHETITDEGVTVLTFENFDTESSYGAEVIGSLTLGSWLKANASFNAYKQVTHAGNLSSELSSDAVGFRTRLSGTAEVMPGVEVQLSQHYRSPMDIPGGRIAAWTRTDFAVQMNVLSSRSSLTLRVRDLLGDPNRLIKRDMDRYYQEYFRQGDSRNIQLSYRYTFRQGRPETEGSDRRGRRH